MKAATIYERSGTLYIHSLSKTTTGLWLMNEPVLAVANGEARDVGDAIKKCLFASREGLPHPTTFRPAFDVVQELAGVKSYRAFVKSAKCVQAWMKDDRTVTLTPTRNGGARDGFSPLSNKSIVVESSEVGLGSAAIAALEATE